MKLYKRNAQGKPIVWEIQDDENYLHIYHGVVGKTLHKESIAKTTVKVNEYDSRITAKRKEGYKELTEIKDSTTPIEIYTNEQVLINYLNKYLPKYNTTSDGFTLPMLAKTLEDNKPFEKYGTLLGQWKINGLRCIIGCEKNEGDLFRPIRFTYTSREGTKWNLSWFDEILKQKLAGSLIDMMIEEGVYLDGELYIPGYSVNDINSFVKNNTLPQHYKLQYWCYDICCENMSAIHRKETLIGFTESSVIRCKEKEDHLNLTSQFNVLPTRYVYNITAAIEIRNDFINLGFEGLILRNPKAEYQFGKRNSAMFKFKKIDDGLFEVLDIKEDKRGLPIYVLKNDINDELFECTINLPQDKQRQQLDMKSYLIGSQAFVEYRERSGVKQVPFHAKIIKIML